MSAQDILQYGALGLLAAVLLGVYRIAVSLTNRLADRLLSSADHLDATLSRIVERLDAHELADERRHAKVISIMAGKDHAA